MSDQISGSLEQGALLQERYEIIKVLGAGDFGTVYQACDKQGPEVSKLVALKQMPMQMVVNCERQADLRALMTHPAIPRIYNYFTDDEHSFLVQELIQGRDLEQVLAERDDYLSEDTVTAWAIELCDVLDYLHNHSYHPLNFRDLKPNNIMLGHHGQIYLIDFGLARAYPPRFFQEAQPQFEHLRQGLAIGTEGYSPPEQYQGMVGPHSDIYALGASLHHLLTKRDPRREPPFSFEAYPVRSINPRVSTGLETIVMKALNRDMDQRFSSAKEMRLALEALLK